MVQKDAIKKALPAPGHYETKEKIKVLGNYKLKEPKSSFLADAEFQGSLSPSHKYNIKYDLVNTRSIATKLVPSKDKPSAGRLQLKIENNPAPG